MSSTLSFYLILYNLNIIYDYLPNFRAFTFLCDSCGLSMHVCMWSVLNIVRAPPRMSGFIHIAVKMPIKGIMLI